MISVRQIEEKEQEVWDDYVLSHSEASPYHLWAWRNSVAQSYKHEPLYFVAEEKHDITGIFPLFHLKFPGMVNELTALPFCDVGNCLADSVEVQTRLLTCATKIAKELGCRSSSLRGSLRDFGNLSATEEGKKKGKVRMCLSLPQNADVLWGDFKSKLRSQVRKAEKNGVKFYWKREDGVEDFYDVYCQNMHCLGSPPHSKKLFSAIMENYGQRARIGLAVSEGKCIGAGLILSTNTMTSIPWASTLREHNHLGPNMLLYWNFLKFSADAGLKLFDFGRSTEGEGTYNFKKQWGAEPLPLEWFSFNTTSNCVEKIKQTDSAGGRQVAARIWMKLPLSVSNVVGPKLRKYISL